MFVHSYIFVRIIEIKTRTKQMKYKKMMFVFHTFCLHFYLQNAERKVREFV